MIRRIRWIGAGVPAVGPCYLSFYFASDDRTAAAQSASTATFLGALSGGLVNTMTFTIDPEAAIIDPTTGQITGADVVAAGAVTGGHAPPAQPGMAQILMQLQTGVYTGGRAVRGRLNIPGQTQFGAPNGVLDAASVSSYTAAGGALVADGDLMVWSRKHATAYPVVSMTARPRLSTLRSRNI